MMIFFQNYQKAAAYEGHLNAMSAFTYTADICGKTMYAGNADVADFGNGSHKVSLLAIHIFLYFATS